ncbi:phosphotyrosine protein [Punctularia strigosozonata HHB-11173 SS5]|uniref:phosphotyrosine protein n=1 Tax=Punctularia strigosozonata (strain HHB-11173) TaxID=741275 RepID=UPI0004417DCF|nr:phosphotyrosine protein [Punctularia strigosozonata HHB-11173 SS5]EIN14360.1 phosphotyrosine protein [Punctularia strigosozonata HHB-11173 SS5]
MSAIPQWLHTSHNHTHLERVIVELSKRERIRDAARSQSRRRAMPSRTTRRSKVASMLANSVPGISGPEEALVRYYAVSAGCDDEAQRCNRYYHLEPYDRTRVVVGEGYEGHLESGQEQIEKIGTNTGGRYLNANWVRELAGGKWWIATQAPLPNTAHTFLSLLLQPSTRPPESISVAAAETYRTSRVRTIVQLTRNFESGTQKAHVYFPSEVGDHWAIRSEESHHAPPLRVRLLNSSNMDDAHCIISHVSITPLTASGEDMSEPIIFNHLLFHAWPDHGVPEVEERPKLLNFIRLVDQVNKDVSWIPHGHDLDPDPAIIIGCSAGIGRTGSFIALASLMRAYGLMPSPSPSYTPAPLSPAPPPLPASPLGPLPEDLRDDMVAQEIDALREQRPGMVQREEQILLIYEALALAFIQHQHQP